MRVSIVIPCFNEEDVVSNTYDRVVNVVTNYDDYEIIFIDDGSNDSTASIIKSICLDNTKVKLVRFSRNFGHESAITAGLITASGEIISLIDADLQDPPEEIPAMIEKLLSEDLHVVYGVRKSRKGESFFKKITATFFYRIFSWLSDNRVPLDTGNFRIMRREVVDVFKEYDERVRFVRGLLSFVGFRQAPYFYDRDKRVAGETKYGFLDMQKLAFNAIFSFSEKPLRISSSLGIIAMLIALCLIIYSILGHFQGALTGWASIMVSVVFFGGVQLFTIGILGEYLAIVVLEVKKRPLFHVMEECNIGDKS